MSFRPTRLTALVLGDATVLLGVHPRWHAVGTGLARPDAWLDTAGPDTAAAALCAVLLWLAAAWVALGVVAALGRRLPGPAGRACARCLRAVVPTLLLRAVLGSTGLAVLAAPAAHAVPPGHAAPAVSRAAAASALPAAGGVPTPSWPVTPSVPAPRASTPTRLPAPAPPMSGPSAHRPARPAPPPTTSPSTGTARVHRGDSLWLLAARRLGPHAGAGAVAHYWPRIYATNRSVIGDDPSVIHPGQVLHLPTPSQEPR